MCATKSSKVWRTNLKCEFQRCRLAAGNAVATIALAPATRGQLSVSLHWDLAVKYFHLQMPVAGQPNVHYGDM